jgi:GT2 family glycosyltransferase
VPSRTVNSEQIRNSQSAIRNSPEVTIVVVPRERFSVTARSLESIYEHTKTPFSLVYVDGGSPEKTKQYLAQQARQKDFKLIRTGRYLSPNQARNIGFREVESKYAVILDNDVLVSPGWLETLMDCAEKTGAWVVSPLTLNSDASPQTVHAAGGTVRITEERGQRFFYLNHGYAGKALADVASGLQRQETELAEFHCMLVLTEACRRAGPFDERLLSMHEHEDFCLAVRQCGGSLYFEPGSVITYISPPPFAWTDLPYFILRWSEDWNSNSHDHFQNKWGVAKGDRYIENAREFSRDHRLRSLKRGRRITRLLSRALSGHPEGLERLCLFPAEARINRFLVRLLTLGEQRPQGLQLAECAEADRQG